MCSLELQKYYSYVNYKKNFLGKLRCSLSYYYFIQELVFYFYIGEKYDWNKIYIRLFSFPFDYPRGIISDFAWGRKLPPPLMSWKFYGTNWVMCSKIIPATRALVANNSLINDKRVLATQQIMNQHTFLMICMWKYHSKFRC